MQGSCRMWRILLRDVIYDRPIYMRFEWFIWKLHAILTSRWCRLLGRLRGSRVTRRALAAPTRRAPSTGLHQSTSVYMTRRTHYKACEPPLRTRHLIDFSAKSWLSVLAVYTSLHFAGKYLQRLIMIKKNSWQLLSEFVCTKIFYKSLRKYLYLIDLIWLLMHL